MKLQESERDLFAAFGAAPIAETELNLAEEASNENALVQPEPVEEKIAQIETAPATIEIDLSAPQPARAPSAKYKAIKTGFSWTAFTGGLAGFVWAGAAVGGPLAYYGVDAVMAMDPAAQAALIALAAGPAMLFWLGGAAAGEAFKARKLAAEITRMAQSSFNPFEGAEDHAKRLSETVRSEIETLNHAVATALARLGEFKHAAQANVAVFDDAVAASRQHVDHMAETLGRERDAIVELNGEMRSQTETVAHSVGRQVRLMREATKLVKSELGAAEHVLEGCLGSFSSSAQLMAERTQALSATANASNAAADALNATMGSMLEGLSEATQLTAAARQSADDARMAAHDAASAVLETTQRAVDMIRAESDAMQETATETLARLQSAAEAARAASEESQAAADRHAASIERRLSALAATAGAAKKAAPAPTPAPRAPEPKPATVRRSTLDQLDAVEGGDLYAAAAQAQRAETAPPQRKAWTNLFAMPSRPEPKAQPIEEEVASELMSFSAPKMSADEKLQRDVLALIEASGVDVDGVLDAADLEHIAQSSRAGGAARRQAVVDAAPLSVNRILRHLRRNAEAAKTAESFRARPDLAKSERRGEASDLVRAYLLIDAALD